MELTGLELTLGGGLALTALGGWISSWRGQSRADCETCRMDCRRQLQDQIDRIAREQDELVGVRSVDQLGRLIWAALVQNFSANVIMNQSDYALETVERFPLLLGGMDITLTVPRFMGADRTL